MYIEDQIHFLSHTIQKLLHGPTWGQRPGLADFNKIVDAIDKKAVFCNCHPIESCSDNPC